MRFTVLALASLLTTLRALQITSPTSGSSVDPSQPITVKWTSSSSDPSTFNLLLSSTENAYGSSAGNTIATNVQTSAGSYTIPANEISYYGAGFAFVAESAGGNKIGTSGDFLLGYNSNRVVTLSNGQLSLAPAATGDAGSPTTAQSPAAAGTSGAAGSMTASGAASSGAAASSDSSGNPFAPSNLSSATASMTIHPSSSFTMSSSASMTMMTTSSSSGSRSSATAASTSNAQPRLGVGKEFVGAAGFFAGLVAIIA